MRLPRMALALAAFFGLTTVVSAASKGTKAIPAAKKHHHLHHVHGVVVSVHHDMVKGHGEIKVKVHHHHHKKLAKSASATATTKKKHHHGIMTFHVTHTTKVERVVHSLGTVHRHKNHFGDVHQGEHVRVAFNHHHHAHEVDILVHQHKKLTTPKPPLKKPAKIKK